MRTVRTIDAFIEAREGLPSSVGFVPTMGALHKGHLSLMDIAASRADHVVVSIFVNPTQFGPNEDMESYPRDVEGDIEKCRAQGCDLLFLPDSRQMYPDGGSQMTEVRVDPVARYLCGTSRPGHFSGVATVVTKLFHIVRPDLAVFGQKDYQQLALIRRLVLDLHFPIEIIGGPIFRESDGLAMSSRNLRLSDVHRRQAVVLSQGLALAWEMWNLGERQVDVLVEAVRSTIVRSEAARVDYIECVHPHTIEPYRIRTDSVVGDGAVMAVAACFEQVRLIDNLRLDHARPDNIP
jgi:pantoate--beta-alanine ligase